MRCNGNLRTFRVSSTKVPNSSRRNFKKWQRRPISTLRISNVKNELNVVEIGADGDDCPFNEDDEGFDDGAIIF
eukprot:3737945-Karenia_brevis.AAC.1